MFLVRYNNRRNPVTFARSFDRLFEDLWSQPFLANPSNWEDDSVVWAPRADVRETEDEYQIHVDLPGLKKDEVSITLEDGVLTVQGERKQEKEEKGKNRFYAERAYGSFRRSFNLASKVDEKKVKAHMKDGVLSIILPKAEEVKPREIAIN